MSWDPSLPAKETFYTQLNALDAPLRDEDEDDLSSRDQDLRNQSRPFFDHYHRHQQKQKQPRTLTNESIATATPNNKPKKLFATRATTLPPNTRSSTARAASDLDRPHNHHHIDQATPSSFTAGASKRTNRQADPVPSSSASFVEDTPFLQNPFPSIFASKQPLQRSATTPGALSSMVKNPPPPPAEQSPSVMSSANFNNSSSSRGRASSTRGRPRGSRARGGRGRGRGRGGGEAADVRDAVVVPECEQVLKGLRFLYVPKEEISVRGKQMERARHYGAVVTDQLLDCTHVIVDDHLKYDDIKNHIAPALGRPQNNDDAAAGAAPPLVARAQWPIACAQEKRLLPISGRFLVWGMPVRGGGTVAAAATTASSSSQASDHPGKRDDVPPCTPPSQRDAASPVVVQQLRPDDKRKADDGTGKSPEPVVSTQENDVIDESVVIPSQQYTEHTEANPGEGDELSHLINRVRAEFKDLPRLEEEEEDDATLSLGPGGEETDDTDDEPPVAKKKQKRSKSSGGNSKAATTTSPAQPEEEKKKNLAEYFACNRGGTKDQTSRSDNPNAPTIAVLAQMLEYYVQTNNHWRQSAYRHAINTLSREPALVTTAAQAAALPHIGKRLADKIEEIVRTKSLQRLEHARADPTSRALTLFLGIYGVGTTTVEKWLAQGFRTLADLTGRASLTANQRVGIAHYDDINARIPRAEVTRIGAFVRAAAARVDEGVTLLVGGSYRRGADTSGDVDFIVTKPGTTSSDDLRPFLEALVAYLTKVGFLTAELASHHNHSGRRGGGDDDAGSKWHGCCVLPPDPETSGANPNHWRRIDFLLVPETEYGAALIYFTGNDIFNRSIRLLASRKGMRLNQRGLYKDVLRGSYGRQKITTGELVEGRDERRIFDILGVKWRGPEERWC